MKLMDVTTLQLVAFLGGRCVSHRQQFTLLFVFSATEMQNYTSPDGDKAVEKVCTHYNVL